MRDIKVSEQEVRGSHKWPASFAVPLVASIRLVIGNLYSYSLKNEHAFIFQESIHAINICLPPVTCPSSIKPFIYFHAAEKPNVCWELIVYRLDKIFKSILFFKPNWRK